MREFTIVTWSLNFEFMIVSRSRKELGRCEGAVIVESVFEATTDLTFFGLAIRFGFTIFCADAVTALVGECALTSCRVKRSIKRGRNKSNHTGTPPTDSVATLSKVHGFRFLIKHQRAQRCHRIKKGGTTRISSSRGASVPRPCHSGTRRLESLAPDVDEVVLSTESVLEQRSQRAPRRSCVPAAAAWSTQMLQKR